MIIKKVIVWVTTIILHGSALRNVEFTFVPAATELYLKNTIYNVITPSLLSDCAVQCLQDAINICSRFLWESGTEKCMLQSDNVTSDISSQLIDRGRSTLYFYKHHGCTIGYDYDRQTQTCIKMVLDYMNWNAARETCKEDGADLISISSLEKWHFVVNYCGDRCKHRGHWIGLYNTTWVTGEPFKILTIFLTIV
ncbi:unnamed protein product [Mytilus edulis]|uniref:C-type lectin domain-containing protein n=1 Tax=Mytilus edulis TaxID=6550 RepID=A0A8S3STW9_MYTED|nr:unnamed protein product [Mytilus edulis]